MHLFALFALVVGGCVAPVAVAATPDALTPQQALRELRILERTFQELHPGLTRYQTPEGLAAEFAAARESVAEGATPGQMYLLASRLSASLRCGHTWTNPLNQGESMQAVLAALPALPVDVRLAQGRMLVVASADPAVKTGDELLAVDGRTIPTLLATLMPYLRADGSSDGKRVSQLESTGDGGALDRLLPLVHPPGNGGYALRLRSPKGVQRTVLAPGMTAADKRTALAAAGVAQESDAWERAITGDTAVLTLPTFAFWGQDFDASAYLAESFAMMSKQGVRRLVIDLRRNEGGDAAIGRELLGYLIRKPYVVPAGRVEYAYERVPYDLARFLDTWDFGFFDRTDKVRRGAGRAWLPLTSPPATVVAPNVAGFTGRVVLLTGPRMSSAGYLFARDAKAAGAALLVGQPTGGNLRGLNGGELAWVRLPHSGVAVDIPLVATIFDGAPDAPVIPDLRVETTLEDLAAGRDPEMAAALGLF